MPAHSPPAQREALRRDAVLTRIGLARAGQWQLLAQTAQREAERRAQRRGHAAPSGGLEGRALANAVQSRAHKGEWRSAASLLQSRGVAPPTGHTRDALARKLVGGPGDLLSPRVRPTAGSGVSRDALYRALTSAPATSGPGPTGIRFSHLQWLRERPRALVRWETSAAGSPTATSQRPRWTCWR